MIMAPEVLVAGTEPQGLPIAVQVRPVLARDQLTPVLVVLETVAENCCVAVLTATEAVWGATATLMAGGGGGMMVPPPELPPQPARMSAKVDAREQMNRRMLRTILLEGEPTEKVYR